MTEQSQLERRYRRWLFLYPQAFRAEHGDELVEVLRQGAEPGRSHPRFGEVTDLMRHGLGRRAQAQLPGNWERRHARVMVPVRLAIAAWLCFISAMLISFHQGEVWLFVLIPTILTHLGLAYRLRHPVARR